VLEEITDEPGEVRSGLRRAAMAYARAVGAKNVDIHALAARLAEEGRRHRTYEEVDAYNLTGMARWVVNIAAIPHPAQGFLDKVKERLEVEEEERPPLPRLNDFLPVSKDRDGTLAKMHAKIEELVTEGLKRIAIRTEIEKAENDARDAVVCDFLEELGKEQVKELNTSEKNRLGRRKAKAAKAARLEVLERNGIKSDLEITPKHELITGVQGGGKTQAIVRRLAREAKGKVNVYLPTIAKAKEVAEALRAAGSIRRAIVVLGRMTEKDGEPKGGERMCRQDPELIDQAQRNGIKVRKSICNFCPFRFDCDYLQQVDEVAELEDRILLLSHEMMFLMPEWARAELHIIDESVVTKFAVEDRIEPGLLFQPDLWTRVPFYEHTAMAVRDALQKPGHELEELKAAGIEDKDLANCAAHIRIIHDNELQAIREALEVPDDEGGAARRAKARRAKCPGPAASALSEAPEAPGAHLQQPAEGAERVARRDECDPARLGRGEGHRRGRPGAQREGAALRDQPPEGAQALQRREAGRDHPPGRHRLRAAEPVGVRLSRPRASLCGRASGDDHPANEHDK
jgi:hypothetical protein